MVLDDMRTEIYKLKAKILKSKRDYDIIVKFSNFRTRRIESLEEENEKLREVLEDIKEKLSPPRRDYTGACFYIAEEALKGSN